LAAVYQHHPALTLVLALAVGIFALFSAMAYGSLLRILDTRDRLQTERDFWRGLSISLLLVEQNYPLAQRVADYVYVIAKGQIVHHCSMTDLDDNEDIKVKYLCAT